MYSHWDIGTHSIWMNNGEKKRAWAAGCKILAAALYLFRHTRGVIDAHAHVAWISCIEKRAFLRVTLMERLRPRGLGQKTHWLQNMWERVRIKDRQFNFHPSRLTLDRKSLHSDIFIAKKVLHFQLPVSVGMSEQDIARPHYQIMSLQLSREVIRPPKFSYPGWSFKSIKSVTRLVIVAIFKRCQ